VVRLVVTGGSLTRRPQRSLRCLLVETLTNKSGPKATFKFDSVLTVKHHLVTTYLASIQQ